MDYDEAVGQQLRIAKMKSGLTNAQITERTGVSYETFKRYMNGARTTPMDVLVKLCRTFGMAPSELLRRAEYELSHAAPSTLPDELRSRLLDGPNRPSHSQPDNHAANGM
jgi:transcriptional regulator with XRE-family HTH domain